LAGLVGSVGVGVLGLSVVHCTESISLLTGSHWLLAGLLAVGIDAGMVASELAELASHGTGAAASVKPWARGHTIAAVLLSVLSVLLNAYALAGFQLPRQQAGRLDLSAGLGGASCRAPFSTGVARPARLVARGQVGRGLAEQPLGRRRRRQVSGGATLG
jgi:hypothetical protein